MEFSRPVADKMSLGSDRETIFEGGTSCPDGHLGFLASQKPASPELATKSMVPPSSEF